MGELGRNMDVGEDRRTIRWSMDCSGNKKRNYNYGFLWIISSQFGLKQRINCMVISLYRHKKIYMGIPSHNITNGELIQIKNLQADMKHQNFWHQCANYINYIRKKQIQAVTMNELFTKHQNGAFKLTSKKYADILREIQEVHSKLHISIKFPNVYGNQYNN